MIALARELYLFLALDKIWFGDAIIVLLLVRFGMESFVIAYLCLLFLRGQVVVNYCFADLVRHLFLFIVLI